MDPIAKIFVFIDCCDDIWMKVARKRSCEFDSFDTRGCDRSQQATKRSSALELIEPDRTLWAIAVYILSNQVDFAIAIVAQSFYFIYYFGSEPAFFPATRIRNDAVCAELVAPFDYRHESDVF